MLFNILVYEDYMSIYNALKYLHDIYKFNPKFMHIDYSKDERKTLLQKNLFNSTMENTLLLLSKYTECCVSKRSDHNLLWFVI